MNTESKIIYPEFAAFDKIARWSREIFVTEKIDGTNGVIHVNDLGTDLLTGSRNGWLLPDLPDNFGFRHWATQNKEELLKLGPGTHYGEWWGAGIGRRYELKEKRFSLFNTSRWTAENAPKCCSVVPILYRGPLDQNAILSCLEALKIGGSRAAPGFMKPEGVVIYHVAANTFFKKTIENDESAKSAVR